MMAQVKAIYAELNALEDYTPEDHERFCVLLQVMVGPRNDKGEESFDIKVCSPKWLEQEVEREGFVLGMHKLIVAEYNPVQIRKVLIKFFERYSGDSWREIALKLGRMGSWEFEDYGTG